MSRVPLNRYLVFILVAASGLAWDLYSKSSVFSTLGYPGQASQWVKSFFDGWITFRLYTSFNQGALWGMAQGYTWLFASLSVAAFFGILYWLFVAKAAHSWWLTLSLGFIMAGTLGNLYDRLGLPQCVHPVTGERIYAVRDFLLFTFGGWPWPVFNFADVFLVTGACMLVLHSLLGQPAGAEQRFREGESALPASAASGTCKAPAESRRQ
ncbi:MAG TPA: signal peptidase II [Planctomycetaceae bacterium]|nr:signal peptidase II [Planctomycetaceae bacterium]